MIEGLFKAAIIGIIGMLFIDLVPYQDNMRCEDYKNVTTCPEEYFSQNYFDAREKFRELAKEAGANPMKPYLVSGEDYTMDIAVIPGKGQMSSTKALIHMCGTHGIEGFVGSAIQAKLLSDIIANKSNIEEETERPTLVFVHAVNPYGFAQLRRFDADNVDLNRNHLTSEERKEVTARDTDFVGLDRLKPLMEYKKAPTLVDRYIFLFVTAYHIAWNGITTLKRALVTGQYHNSSLPFYGGTETQPSIHILQKALQELLPKEVDKVIAIDVHTGLGPHGVDTFLMPTERKTAEAIWPGQIIQENTDNIGASTGYEHVKGVLSIQKMLPGKQVFQAMEEFGTIHGIFVARAIILENAAFLYAKGSRVHEITKEWMRDAFYPQSMSFKRSVVKRGATNYVQALDYLKQW
eukprot:Tbor_TRINITY_DN5760_c0_g1::TRINITY_DN5760_c0_g1_i1::g.19999::m.19999